MENYVLFDLTVGQLRALMAYADGDMTVEDFWDEVDDSDLREVGFDTFEDEDYEEEDEYFLDDDYEEELDDAECSVVLDPVEEDMAHSLACDIREGRYSLEVIRPFYSPALIDRVIELI